MITNTNKGEGFFPGSGFYRGICDVPKCTNEEETEIDSADFGDDREAFRAAVQDLRERGWVSRKNDKGEWENVCPACVDEGK